MFPSLGNFDKKKILITGHTGFKGAWLSRILSNLGAEVYGISLEAEKNSLYNLSISNDHINGTILDINSVNGLDKTILEVNPNLVFHLAAQPLVRRSYKDPRQTFQTNVMGTFNVISASLECSATQGIIAVTTDKVYKNFEKLDGYSEGDALGGRDPYSASKSASEMVINAMQGISNLKNNIPIVSARSGNVIGGGDYAEDRLLPDLVRGFRNNLPTKIRNPKSLRPWQHVLDPLAGYIAIGIKLLNKERISSAYNFGPGDNSKLSVAEMASLACDFWPNNKGWEISEEENYMPESGLLWLNSKLAREELGWINKLDSKEAIRWTIEWELGFDGSNALQLMDKQISEYGMEFN
jgi:CDP-glucose 4,6-dehydratase